MSQVLTRSFFEEELHGLKEAFAREKNADKVVVDLILKGGGHVRLEGQPTCTETYIAFDRKDGSRTVLGYGAIMGLNLSAEKTGKLGFHA